MKQWTIQLRDHVTAMAITAAGGVGYVATAGAFAKVALLDAAGASLTNPVALVLGQLEFFTSNDVTSVDLYILAPSGHFVVAKGITPSGPNDLNVDLSAGISTWRIPFAIGDTTAAVETDTGFALPANSVVMPTGAGVHIGVLDAAITIDVGTEADPNGFLDAVTTATALFHKGTLADGAQTLGVLLKTDESGGDFVPEADVSIAENVVYTLLVAANTAEGIIVLHVMPPVA